MKFNEHYLKFLNIDLTNENIQIAQSSLRNKPIAYDFKHFLIASNYKDKMLFSIVPEFHSAFTKYVSNTVKNCSLNTELMKKIDNFFFNKISGTYVVRNMIRLSLDSLNYSDTNSSQITTLSIQNREQYLNFINTRVRGEKYLNKQWSRRRSFIKAGRLFAIIEDNQIVSCSELSNVNFNGANIVVQTHPKYRRKGYARQLVIACTKWCLNKNIVPVYWVDEKNTPSLELAKGLGFKICSNEIVVSKVI